MESLLRERIQLRISENLNFALSKLRSHTQLLPCTPRAGWYLPLQLTNDRDSSEFALELLQTKGVYLHPGDLFDFAQSNHLVISLLTDPEIFQEGIRRLLDRRS
jgi:aspartate/methionine/tyrosine aminotransferase